jgi:integrase
MPRIKVVSAYIRKLKEGLCWYASWQEDGKRVVRPTGVAWNARRRDGGRSEAVEIGRRLKDEREAALRKPGQGEVPTLAEYAHDFYVWGQCSYIRRQHAKGRTFNRHWAMENRGLLVNYVFPRFGTARLDTITRPAVERWLVDLPLSNQSKNHLLYGLRTIFREAESERLIASNPLEHVEPMAKQGRKRDIFSLPELKLLFPPDHDGLIKVWGQMKYAALYLTMATTGIREGEARALQWKHVLPTGWLVVERAVKIDGTIGALKKRERTGEPRVVALPARTQDALSWWHEQSQYGAPDDLVFFGDNADHPLNRNTFQDILARALDGEHREDKKKPTRIERGGRYLTTHSLRHTYNTMMRRSIPADALLALMGHRDSRMSDVYDHPEIADRIKALEGVRGQIESALSW